jgi:hypothetical protein
MAELERLSDDQLSDMQSKLLTSFKKMANHGHYPRESSLSLAHLGQALIALDRHIIKNKLTIK